MAPFLRGQPFTSCWLTAVEWSIDGPPLVGAFLVTTGGSAYRIDEVRPRRTGGYRLRCTRWPRGDVPADALIYDWWWRSRERGSGT